MAGGQGDRWIIHDERVVDDTRKTKLHIASVELPDGVKFEQYVLRCPRAAMCVAVNDLGELLMIRRHRFIVDANVWELPGGYVDDTEDLQSAALRELTEETGWAADRLELIAKYQPMIGIADHECHVFLATGVRQTTSAPDINEAEVVAWIPLDEASKMLESGEIVGAASVLAVMALLSRRTVGSVPAS